MKSWLEHNNIGIYSIHNEGKSVVADGLDKTVTNEIYKIIYNCYISINQ